MRSNGAVLTNASDKKIHRRQWLSLSFLHFANDLHSGVLPTVIPMLAQSISLTLSQAGILNSAFGMIHILGQPVFGFIADRQSQPYNAAIGPVLCALGACLLPLAPNFSAAILLVGLLGVGTAMFHPQGTGLCGRSAGKDNLAFFIAVFAACGTLGSAIGPVYVVYAMDSLGLKAPPLMVLPIFLVCLYFFRHYDADKTEKRNGATIKEDLSEFIRSAHGIMKKIYGVVTIATLRDATNLGIRIFIPTLVVSQGGTIKQGGMLVLAVTLASAVAGMIGGRLADKIGHDRILIGAISISPFFLLASLNTKGYYSVVMLITGYLFLLASSSVTTAMSQQRCSNARSMASSLSMGFSWGLANLFTSPVGFAADRIGLRPAMCLVALMPWTITAWYISKRFRTGKGRRQ